MIGDGNDMRGRYIDNVPSEWLEQCLAIMALDPETRDANAFQPVGIVNGLQRPEYGPAIYDLACQVCEATWAGVPGDPCWWCERSAQIQLEHQADLLLTPPDVDPDDATFEARMAAWAERLARGIDAGIITQQQAINAARATDRRTA